MKKFLNPKFFMQVMMFIAMFSVILVTFTMAYIMFAPDDWPKPFYLAYAGTTSDVSASEGEGHGTVATEEPSHTTDAHSSGASAAYEAAMAATGGGGGGHGGGETGSTGSTHTAGSTTGNIADISAPPNALLEIRPGQGLMVDTGTKIVNLAEPSGRRYVRVNIILEFAPIELAYYTMSADQKTVYIDVFSEEITSKLPIINDAIITMLASKTFETVYTAEGKEALRLEISQIINSRLPEYRVIYVYFTEFVVQ